MLLKTLFFCFVLLKQNWLILQFFFPGAVLISVCAKGLPRIEQARCINSRPACSMKRKDLSLVKPPLTLGYISGKISMKCTFFSSSLACDKGYGHVSHADVGESVHILSQRYFLQCFVTENESLLSSFVLLYHRWPFYQLRSHLDSVT